MLLTYRNRTSLWGACQHCRWSWLTSQWCTFLVDLVYRVDERDAPSERACLADPGEEGRVPARAHRPGYKRVRVVVAPVNPNRVVAAALG